MGQIAHCRRVRSADAELEGLPDWRPKLKWAHARGHLLKLWAMKRGQNAFLHPGADFEIFGNDDGLCKEVVGELLVERQVKADGAAADIK